MSPRGRRRCGHGGIMSGISLSLSLSLSHTHTHTLSLSLSLSLSRSSHPSGLPRSSPSPAPTRSFTPTRTHPLPRPLSRSYSRHSPRPTRCRLPSCPAAIGVRPSVPIAYHEPSRAHQLSAPPHLRPAPPLSHLLLLLHAYAAPSRKRRTTARSLMLPSARTDCAFSSAVGVKFLPSKKPSVKSFTAGDVARPSSKTWRRTLSCVSRMDNVACILHLPSPLMPTPMKCE
ncbi:hypothetical protein T484DRAFT_3275349 [Baffinella frigidus]|nr:hypothetical protein T484DRAFT_3275349 [Cryptophyta sp. CCMP2293]